MKAAKTAMTSDKPSEQRARLRIRQVRVARCMEVRPCSLLRRDASSFSADYNDRGGLIRHREGENGSSQGFNTAPLLL
jgi:hypothetical protein